MEIQTCEALVVHCIDFRIQGHLHDWAEKNLGQRNYDRVAMAGGVLDLEAVLRHVEIARRLHCITKVALISHEDCRAYGARGTLERHLADLQAARQKIEALVPGLAVTAHHLHLDGTFQPVF